MLGLTCLSLAFFIAVYNPLRILTAMATSVHPGSVAFELFSKPPYEILIKIYIYNVSNSEEFLRGEEKLRFNEIGPYVYKETFFNINSSFNENGSLSFVPRRLLDFMPEHSVGDQTVDTVLSPNIPLLAATALLVESSMISNIAVASASFLFGSKPFLNLTISEYLYGYDDPLVTLANYYMPGWIKFPRFGIVDQIMALDNGSNIVTINLNSQDEMYDDIVSQKFAIERWNGSPGLKQWGYVAPGGNNTVMGNSICNTVKGAFLGTMFPPNIEKNTTLRIYRHALCRSVVIQYRGNQTSKDGYEGYLFGVKENVLAKPEKNADNHCYCRDDNDCLLDGLGDMSPCYYGIPIVMSQPHFLNGDPTLLQQVDGLSPDKEKHDFFMIIHPEMGIVIEAKLRLQINLKMPNTYYNSKVTPFNNLVIPLLWVEMNVENVPKQIRTYITLLHHILPMVQQVLMYSSGVVGVVMVFGSALSAVLHFFNNHHKKHSGLKAKYSEIPVFAAKTKLCRPEVLIDE